MQSNSDAQSLASSISSDYAAMESSIAFSIGIGLNRSLRSRLRALAGASESQPIFVRHMQTSAWIEIDPKGSVAARRQKPEGLPSIDLGQAVTREPALGDAVYAASAETRALRRAWKPMGALGPRMGFAVAAAVRPFDRMVSRARTSRLSLCDEDRQSDVLADPPVRQAIKTFSDWPTIPRSTSGAPSSGAATSCSKCTRQANLRKHSASIAPRLHHDRPDGHKVGASGAI